MILFTKSINMIIQLEICFFINLRKRYSFNLEKYNTNNLRNSNIYNSEIDH